MASTTTMLSVVQEMFNRVPDLGWFSTAGSVSTDGITDAIMLANSRYSVDKYAGRWIWRYNLTGADRVKPAADLTVSTGKLLHANATVYSDTSDKAYALTGVHPDVILAAANLGHARISSRTIQPLITFTDADMRRSDANYWNGTSGSSTTSNCTCTKITTDSFEGPSALSAVFSAAGFHRGPTYPVFPGQTIWTAARLKTSASTLAFGLYDTTNAALITTGGASPTTTARDYAVVWRQDVVPAGCYNVQVQINAAAACTAIEDCYWGPYIFGQKSFTLPLDIDESWRLRLIRRTQYYSLPTLTQVWDARSRNFVGDLVPASKGNSGDFTLEINEQDVNPYRLNLGMPIEGLIIQGSGHSGTYGQGYGGGGPPDLATERYVTNSETFAAMTDTSVVRKERLVDFSIDELADRMLETYAENDPGWTRIKTRYADLTAFQVIAHQPQSRIEQGTRQALFLNA